MIFICFNKLPLTFIFILVLLEPQYFLSWGIKIKIIDCRVPSTCVQGYCKDHECGSSSKCYSRNSKCRSKSRDLACKSHSNSNCFCKIITCRYDKSSKTRTYAYLPMYYVNSNEFHKFHVFLLLVTELI